MIKLKENEDLYLRLIERWGDVEKDGYLYPTVYNIINLATMHFTDIWNDDDVSWNPFLCINGLYTFYRGYAREQMWDVWTQFYDELRTDEAISCEIKSLPGYIKYCSFMDDLFDYLDELGYKDGENITLEDAEKQLYILKIKLMKYIAEIDLANVYAED